MQVSNSQRDFARLIRETRFGSIENFRLAGGEPAIGAETDVRVEYRLSGVESPQEVMSEDQYLSRPQVRTMFERFQSVGDGLVECIEIRDGLPARMSVRRKATVQIDR